MTPAGFAGIGDDGAATLSWTANAETDIAGYDLYRSTTPPVDTSGTPLNGPTLIQATTYADSGLINGTTYHYALVAVDGAGNRSAAATTDVVPVTNPAPTVVLNAPANAATGRHR